MVRYLCSLNDSHTNPVLDHTTYLVVYTSDSIFHDKWHQKVAVELCSSAHVEESVQANRGRQDRSTRETALYRHTEYSIFFFAKNTIKSLTTIARYTSTPTNKTMAIEYPTSKCCADLGKQATK